MVRKMIADGMFYPSNANEIEKFIEKHKFNGDKVDANFVIVPHAGYIYSGKTAVKTLSSVNLSDTVIVLSPNHTNFGEKIAVWENGSWNTPLGDVPIDIDLAMEILHNTTAVSDIVAHVREHSIEVLLPILKYLKPDIKIVPITIQGMPFTEVVKFGKAIAPFMKNCTVIVSSDFNHYEDLETTNSKDFLAIDAILKLDSKLFYDKVQEEGISVCGLYPISIAIVAANNLGRLNAKLIDHSTSSEVSGDKSSAVGYAGIIIS